MYTFYYNALIGSSETAAEFFVPGGEVNDGFRAG
jgi:hypothetical protein